MRREQAKHKVVSNLVQIRIFVLLGLTLAYYSNAQAGQLEAKKDKVKVLTQANKSSDVIKELNKGDLVEEAGRKGMYWKVTLQDGKEGFVSVMGLKRLAKKDDGFSDALRKAVQQGRENDDASNVRSRSAVMGVRGLDDSDETAFAGNVKPNPRLIYSMENYQVDKKKVNFIMDEVEKEIIDKMKKKGVEF